MGLQRRQRWTTVEVDFCARDPGKKNDRLCPGNHCQGGKRRCGGAHGEAELYIWSKLREYGLYLHTFLPNLVYYEETPVAPIQASPAAKVAKKKKKRKYNARNPDNMRNNASRSEINNGVKYDGVLRKCGGGRFLFACKNCYNLEPRIVKEMEVGGGKDPMISCKWCNGKEYFLFHEMTYQNSHGVTFYEYQSTRSRLSTTRGNELCRNISNCAKCDRCTYAHSYLELQVWKLEASGETTVDLVRYSNLNIRQDSGTPDGMFHCDRCCLSFSDHRLYVKYMGSKHKSSHIPKIDRRSTGWRFRPLPKTESETLTLCGKSCKRGDNCTDAHGEDELREWEERLEISKARATFRLDDSTDLESFDLHQKPKHISEDERLQTQLNLDPETEIRFVDKTIEWKMTVNITDSEIKLRRVRFHKHWDYQIRNVDDEKFSNSVTVQDNEDNDHEFEIRFKNPEYYGEHVDDLLFELENDNSLYLRFRVVVKGEHLETSARIIDPNDWTLNRYPVRYPRLYQLESYEKRIEDLKLKYQIPPQADENVDLEDIKTTNYARKMHALLYKEERGRHNVLSRLNMRCVMKFGNETHSDGHLFATFHIPVSVSTDEGLLFRSSCNMVYVGKEDDDFAYESAIRWSNNIEEVTIDLSPECVKKLEITPRNERTLQVQFQLDRELFALRHYTVDHIGDKLSLICPSPHQYASLLYDGPEMTCKCLDEFQNKVFKYLQVTKRKEPRNAKINERKSYPPLIVAGPFGTGKTHTIKTILLDLMQNGDKDATILLCTHANSSADLYLMDDRFQQWKSKVLRLYYHGRNLSTVKGVVQQYCLFNDRGFRYPSIEEIRKYRLVVTTFSTALTLNLETGLSGNLFQYIFLDEASQAMEADVIMPLLLADAKQTRVVIAGDHRQTTERMYCETNGRVQTFLERMYGGYEHGLKRNRILLTNNYRCVDGILFLISKLFYKENILKNASKEKCVTGKQPVYFIHIQGECVRADNGEYQNLSEAYEIAKQVHMLIREKEGEEKLVKPEDILVISSFHSQVQLLRQVLRRQGLRNISVQTVQNIQGQEYKVVVLCTVMRRASYFQAAGENFGFLSDHRLLNTALTRAKSLIVVVGDAVTLCSTGDCESSWKAYVKYCEKNDTILPREINVESVKKEIQLANWKLTVSAPEFVPRHKRREQKFDDPSSCPRRESESKEENLPSNENQATSDSDESSYDEGDDNDSWCSEGSVDDLILDDMIRHTMGFDPKKVTVGVRDKGDEYIKYGSDEDENDEENDDDPNVVDERRSRRRRGRRCNSIYPKFTVDQLEQMLRNNPERYKRCTVKVQNWYSARATPIVENLEWKVAPKSSELDESDSIHDFDKESLSSDGAYSLASERANQNGTHEAKPTKLSREIFIETRENLGRTFDQDEVLVEVVETRGDPNNPTYEKQIGKVLGVLKKRYKNPRYRHFLCCPDEFNSSLMCPIDKKLTRFAILAPKDHKQSSRADVPIYKAVVKDKKWMDIKLRKREKLDDKRIYVVRYLKWSEYCLYPLGFVEGSFDRKDFHKYLKLEFNVPGEFKGPLRQAAQEMEAPTAEENSVIDVFTIDPEGSLDLDDAISFEKCQTHSDIDCYLIGIHITDIACVIEEGSIIDKEAHKRFSTFYGGKDGPVHMLPPELATSKCSILPGEIRPAISTFFHSCDSTPLIKRECPVEPQKTFIRSVRRMTYGETEKLLRAGMKNERLEYEEDVRMSEILRDLWSIIWDWRISRLGSEAYYKKSNSYSNLIYDCRAHLLIEEAMISVNANTAAFLSERSFEIPMRVQDAPDDSEWAEWGKMHLNLIPNSTYLTSSVKHLKKLKRIDEGAEESQEDLSEDEDGQWEQAQSRRRRRKRIKRETNQVLSSIDPIGEVRIFKSHWNAMVHSREGNDLELFAFIAACDDLHPSLINSVDRYRSIQKKSSFATQEAFHFSLRLKKYSWTSSPIRRYTDILMQRCIHKALAGEPSTEQTDQAIKRICRFYDARHYQYKDKLARSRVAECLKRQPAILEAAIVQITDAFITIAIPALGKLMMQYARQLHYGNLMASCDKQSIANAIEEEKPKGQTFLTNINLVWKLRYYVYDEVKCRFSSNGESGKTVKIPIQEWKGFVRTISSPPRITDSEYKKRNHLLELIDAVDSMERNAEDGEIVQVDNMIESTPNEPNPIKHKREIKWNVFPGASLLLQISGSHEKSRLPAPAIQLLSVGNDLDVCVEHMRDPLDIFSPDAEKTKDAPVDQMSLASYRKKWEPLVRMDAAHSAVKEISSTTIQGVQIHWNKAKKAKEHLKYALLPDASKNENRVVNYFSLKNRFCYDRYIDFHHGDLLCLRLKGVKGEVNQTNPGMYYKSSIQTYTLVVHAVITRVKLPGDEKDKDVKFMKVFFEPRKYSMDDQQQKFLENSTNKWTVELIPLSFGHRCMQACLTVPALRACSPLIQSICLGIIQPSRVLWGEELEELIVNKSLKKKFNYPLNEEQLRQEQKAIRHDFTIIQGPPGTGKSFLGAQIAAKFAYINKHKGHKKKVLYCGPSNKSVDVAAGFLKGLSDLKIVRVYSTGLEEKLFPNPLKPRSASLSTDDGKMPDESLKSIALHELIRKSGNPSSETIREFDARVKSHGKTFRREEMDRYSRLVKSAKTSQLENADIIICTCSYSALLTDYENIVFEQCVIDECAMCSEPETIIPLVKNNPKQVVLIGDQMQLRPVVTCNKAERLGLGKSLFSRYTEYVGMLTNQYRMHPNIMDFSSRQFYKGKLQCDQSVRTRPKPVNIRISSGCETVFWNVKGDEKVQHFKTADEGEHSKYNMAEARAVIRLLLRLHSYQVPHKKIMVLSPYTAQCARIRNLIQTQHGELKDVAKKVGTVVTSQGSEADFVILSTVRSLPDSSIMANPNIQWRRKNLGFLTDPNQINVALTRARQRLFIIGNKDLLRVDSLWNNLLSSYERKRAIIENLQSAW